MANKVLTWMFILLLLGYNGYLFTKIAQLEQAVIGLTTILVFTNEEAKEFVKELIPASKIKDPELRNHVIKRQLNTHFGSDIREVEYAATKTS